MGRFCGNESLPGPVVSAAPRVRVTFTSDMLVTDRGFSLAYSLSGQFPFLCDITFPKR